MQPCDSFDSADQNIVERAIRRASPGWLRDQHDDLVQMTMVRVLRAGAAITNRPAYLRQAARSTVIDEVRRLRYRTEVGMSTSVSSRMVNSKDLTPETVCRGAEVGAEISAALQALNPARRKAVTLHLQSYSVPEIAQQLQQERKQTANQVYRGLADLKAELTRRGIQPRP